MKRVIFVILVFGLAFCQNQERIKISEDKLSFKLTTGESLSLSGYVETSPYIIQSEDGKLHLFFLSDRPCNNGVMNQCPPTSGSLNLFYAQSSTAYGGGEIPAFATPLTVRNTNNIPFSIDNMRSLMVQKGSLGYKIIYNYDYHGFINTLNVDPEAVYDYSNNDPILPEGGAYFLGGTTHNQNPRAIYKTKDSQNQFYLVEKANNQAQVLPLAIGEKSLVSKMESLVILPKVNEQKEAGDPVFVVLEGYIYFGFTQTKEIYPFLSFNQALDKDGLKVKNLGLLLAKDRADDPNSRLIFSASQQEEIDLYAVKDFSLNELSRQAYREITRAGNRFTTFSIPGPASGRYLYVYLTQNTYSGNLGGIAGADSICNSDPAKPPVGTYKAFLVGGGRTATTTGTDSTGQNDWVLANEGTDYMVYSSKLIAFKSNNHGLIQDFYPQKFLSAISIWTGMQSNMTTGNTCGNWTSGSGNNGSSGYLWDDTLERFLSYTNTSCDASYNLLCVQVP